MKTWLEMVLARQGSDEPAVITVQGTWSGRELIARAAGGADFLDSIGAPAGRPVVALLTSNPSAFALAIGAAATDRALAPFGPKLTVSEIAPCVALLNAEFIVAEASSEELGHALAERTGLRLAILPELGQSTRTLAADIGEDRPAAILHTSGTTGQAKPVVFSQGRLAARVRVNVALVELGPGVVFATASPFHHIGGLGMLFVGSGSGAALFMLPRFDVDAWKGLAAHGVTHAVLVPTMIEMLLDADALALPDLRLVQYGASPIRPDTLARAMAALPGVRLLNLFGQTEGSPITALLPEDHDRAISGLRPELLTSVGRPVPGVDMVIDQPGPDGVGEIVARGEHFFGPAADGWVHTGDLGRVDDEGYLYLAGRMGDKIIRGGENVYPIEVEQVLALHPLVLEACVFGLPDATYGERVAAAIVAAPGVDLPPWDELRAFARVRLGGFKVPTQWEHVVDLPRNALGKVLRRQLILTRTTLAVEKG
jgi:acyl-CoA synthetase (AMP-forming)/AMP-acid ligase II